MDVLESHPERGAPFTLTISDLDAGWCSVTVSAGGQSLPMDVSFLSDGLGDLTERAVRVLRGLERARCCWADEPGEYRWVLARRGEQLRIRVLGFAREFSQLDDEQGKLLFETECDLLRFASQWKGQLHQLLNTLGPEGYRLKWRHDFPLEEFEQLSRLIHEQEQARRPAWRE